MKQPKTFVLLSVIVAVLVLGVAYAAISNINLEITGTASAAPSDSNFSVAFGKINTEDKPTYVATKGNGKVEFTTPSDTSATMTVTDLVSVGDEVTATFYVINNSTDLKAAISQPTVSGTTEYFTVTSALTDSEIGATGKTTITVTVKLVKVPITDTVSTNIKVGFTASPVNV